MTDIIRRVVVACCALALLGGVIVWGSLARAEETVPLKVTSDTMQYNAAKRTVRFAQNVHVTHPDAQMWADVVTALLADSSQADTTSSPQKADGAGLPAMGGGELETLVAEGNVRLRMNDGRTGTSERATYHINEGLLVMEGHPVLVDGENSVRGNVIRFYVHENRSEVLGSDDTPVEALFLAPKRAKQ